MQGEGKYAVFLDIDNTLLSGGVVPQANIKAIDEARRKGNYVFIDTARSYGFIPPELLATVEVDGVVCGIGTDLRFHGEQIFSKTMTLDEVVKIVELCNDGKTELIFEGESESVAFCPQPKHDDRCTRVSSVDEIIENFDNVKLSKVFINRDFTEKEREILSEKYTLYQHATYSEFVEAGYSKAAGLKKMASLVGVPIERCIAMGDSANDAEMLECAGISVAMGNAIDEIKEMCDYVSCDAKDGGVAEAIHKFVLTE